MTARIQRMGHPNRSRKEMSPSIWPRPEEVRQAREAAGLTQEQAAALVHAGGQTWVKWERDATSDSARRMHPSTWELFRVKLQVIKMLETGALNAEDVRKLQVYLPPLPGAGS